MDGQVLVVARQDWEVRALGQGCGRRGVGKFVGGRARERWLVHLYRQASPRIPKIYDEIGRRVRRHRMHPKR